VRASSKPCLRTHGDGGHGHEEAGDRGGKLEVQRRVERARSHGDAEQVVAEGLRARIR
jgi:hypothetical protein